MVVKMGHHLAVLLVLWKVALMVYWSVKWWVDLLATNLADM